MINNIHFTVTGHNVWFVKSVKVICIVLFTIIIIFLKQLYINV